MKQLWGVLRKQKDQQIGEQGSGDKKNDGVAEEGFTLTATLSRLLNTESVSPKRSE